MKTFHLPVGAPIGRNGLVNKIFNKPKEQMENNKLEINCTHGKEIASIICCHLLNSVDPVGFIENSSDPYDLQGWCYACEFFFQQEGEITDEFKKFNNAKVVCEKCYEEFKNAHLIK